MFQAKILWSRLRLSMIIAIRNEVFVTLNKNHSAHEGSYVVDVTRTLGPRGSRIVSRTIRSRSSEQEIRCGLNANCTKSGNSSRRIPRVARSAAAIKQATRSPCVLIRAYIRKVKSIVYAVLEFWGTFSFRVTVACCCTLSSPIAAWGKKKENTRTPPHNTGNIQVTDITKLARVHCAEIMVRKQHEWFAANGISRENLTFERVISIINIYQVIKLARADTTRRQKLQLLMILYLIFYSLHRNYIRILLFTSTWQ